jgi:tripartite-type tricarboxylate transporter receptor subunit TctC
VVRINALLREAVASPGTRERLRTQVVETQIQSPNQFRAKVRAEIERWAPVVEKSGIKGSL